jgi:hypothetical protein
MAKMLITVIRRVLGNSQMNEPSGARTRLFVHSCSRCVAPRRWACGAGGAALRPAAPAGGAALRAAPAAGDAEWRRDVAAAVASRAARPVRAP